MDRPAKFGILLTAVALACWPAAVLAGPTVPYRDSASGTVLSLTPTGPGTFLQVVQATGVATHLGRFQFNASHTFDITKGLLLNGRFTSTAADGSTVSGTYSGTIKFLTPTSTRAEIDGQVLEGTRRLSGVKGSFHTVLMGTGGTPGATFTFRSVGTLTKP